MINQEYSAFGPWVIEIQDVDGIPALFRTTAPKLDECQMLIKIPRDIERRNAKPGMDLYNHLAAIGKDQLIILSRRPDGGVRELRCNLAEVEAVRVTHNLLRGELHLLLPGEPLVLVYNTVSADIMAAFVRLIRQSKSPELKKEHPAQPVPDRDVEEILPEPDLSYFYINLRDRLGRADGAGEVLLHQHEVILHRNAGLFEPLMRLLFPHRICELMILDAPRELIIVTRHDGVKTTRLVDNGYGILFVPKSSLGGFQRQSSERYPDVEHIWLSTPSHRIEIPLMENNPYIPGFLLWCKKNGISGPQG
jgi:hypothetical protein